MGATFRLLFAPVVVLLVVLLAGGFCLAQSTPDKQADFAAHIQKAKQYLDEKRPDLAIPELQAAAEINPDSVETQGNLGVLLYFQGKPADAIPHLRAAVDRQPGMGKIQGLLGLAEVHLLNFADGRKDLEAAFPAIPDPKFKVEVGLELVSLYTQSGDLEQASAFITQLRKISPDDAEVLYAAYRTYAALSSESMLALSLASPDSAQMHQMLAHEEYRQGNSDGAVAQYRKAIAINPHLPGIHFELAEALSASQSDTLKKEAEQEYRTALKEDPHDEKSVLRLAEIDAQKGNTEQSFKGYSRAVELQPADADAKLGLAKTLLEMNENDKALALLESTVQLEPTNATAHYRLGTLYRKLGRTDDAKREIELYKKYKDMKEKLRALYKELQIQPSEITADEPDQK
ncbi:MAG TPA: tetratricopeptide repeat protein [Candidatus Solibacter sp.]|nr:tetratricopeptide repeat protein [Candidatus Solibacter sp.]